MKTGSESRCVEREVNNRDDDRKKSGVNERNNTESSRRKSQRPDRCKTVVIL